jgi:Flp pilus assembly protein TadG
MIRHLNRKLAARARILARRWHRNTEGVAAIEFAFIVPIMSVMFIGAVELSQAITVDRRVSQISSATADLVARSEAQISQTEITDIMKAGGYIMDPYDQGPLRIVLRNVSASSTSVTNTKQSWVCTYQGNAGAGGTSTQTCSCTNTAQTIPANLVGLLDSVVVAEVTYAYKPTVFDYFMKRSYGSSGTAGTYTLAATTYLKPRGQAAMLLQANGTPCPSPTF